MAGSIYRHWYGIIVMILVTECLAQAPITVSGIVLDAESFHPLPFAHVVINHQSALTPDESGWFKIKVNAGDTLIISHVSYQSSHHIIYEVDSSKTVVLTVFLEKTTRLLSEIEINPFPASLKDFKQEILDLDLNNRAFNPQNLLRQQEYLTLEIIVGPKISYDAYENYRGINQPKDFTLFSSGPNKGIGRFIRSLKKKKK